MKIAVVGLWHLGTVTSACLANAGHKVVAFDSDQNTIKLLQNSQPPVFEPGLEDLIICGQDQNNLEFTSELGKITDAEIIWITFDTPVDEQDIADVEFVLKEVSQLFPYISANAIIVISSQIPVGTTRKLLEQYQNAYPEKPITFACIPENLRLGKALQVFQHPDRVIIGLSNHQDKPKLIKLLKPFSENLIWMSLESAEMTKHALNAFFATSVVFINELATLCEQVGADAREVEQGLKSEERIGLKAYLKPGAPIAGGTLARDVNFLTQMGQKYKIETPLFSSLLHSNDNHKRWVARRMLDIFQDLHCKTITTLGLTYKAGTDTLRRSTAVEMCMWLKEQGAHVVAYDPMIHALPTSLNDIINLKLSLQDALDGSDAIIIATEWPEFLSMTGDALITFMKQPRVFDANGFLFKTLGNHQKIDYYTVGGVSECN